MNWPNLARLSILAAFLLTWEFLTPLFFDTRFFPRLSEVLQSGIALFSSGKIYPHLGVTLYELIAGLLIGSSIAVLFGLGVGVGRLARTLDPFISTLYAVPKILLFPLFILWFGAIAVESKIAFGAFAAFFPIATNIIASVREINPGFLRLSHSLGATTIQIYRTVILPSIVPSLFAGLRLGVVLTLIAVLMAELIVAERGIGLLISSAAGSLQVSEMIALLIVISIFSISITQALLIIEKRALRWSP